MTSGIQQNVLSSPKEQGAIILAGTTFDERQDEFFYDAPSAGEWRRVETMLVEQVLLRMAGYADREEFTKDGCRFEWDRVRFPDGRASASRH